MGASSIIDKDIRLTYAFLDLELILDEVNQGLGRYCYELHCSKLQKY